MPTSHTCRIEDDESFTFEAYAWSCARAFGALIAMRDDPMDAPVPAEFRPSTHHADRMNEVNGELAELGRMSTEDVLRRIREESEEVERANRESREKSAVKAARYSAMRARVEAWEPPTPDHEGLKRYMLEQIDRSARFAGPYLQDMPIADPAGWVADRRESLLKDLKYHETEHAAEIGRTDERNEWVGQLRRSVPIGGSPVVAATDVTDPGSWRDRDPLF